MPGTAMRVVQAASVLLSCLVAATGPGGAVAGEAYRWVDDQGLVHFSDSRPDDDILVAVVDLYEPDADYDPEQDPHSVLNQAAQIHERWREIEQRKDERLAARAARMESFGQASRPDDAKYRANDGIYYATWPTTGGPWPPASAGRQVRALHELDLLRQRPYSINSGTHRERVARSRALPLVGLQQPSASR